MTLKWNVLRISVYHEPCTMRVRNTCTDHHYISREFSWSSNILVWKWMIPPFLQKIKSTLELLRESYYNLTLKLLFLWQNISQHKLCMSKIWLFWRSEPKECQTVKCWPLHPCSILQFKWDVMSHVTQKSGLRWMGTHSGEATLPWSFLTFFSFGVNS